MLGNDKTTQMKPMLYHGMALVFLTFVASTVVSMFNSHIEELAIMGLGLIACAVTSMAGWLVARKSRWGPAPTRVPEATEISTATAAREYGVACCLAAALLLVFGVVGPLSVRFRLSMFKGIFDRVTLEHEAAALGGLGLATWGIAYGVLGIHYVTGRHRWFAHLSLLGGVLGWFLLASAIWLQNDSTWAK